MVRQGPGIAPGGRGYKRAMNPERPDEELEEIQAEKEAQVLRREAVEQELMQEGDSAVGTRLDEVEDDEEDPRRESR